MSAELDSLKAAFEAYKTEVATDIGALLDKVTALTAAAAANPDAAEIVALTAEVQAQTEALHAKVTPAS